jgi:hypothetical protein
MDHSENVSKSPSAWKPKNTASHTTLALPPSPLLHTAHEFLASSLMPSRGRHQSSSKECHLVMRKIEAIHGVIGVIIGRSYGGKSLGKGIGTGAVKIQRKISGGIKAVTQSEKGLQEIFIRTEAGMEDEIIETILKI